MVHAGNYAHERFAAQSEQVQPTRPPGRIPGQMETTLNSVNEVVEAVTFLRERLDIVLIPVPMMDEKSVYEANGMVTTESSGPDARMMQYLIEVQRRSEDALRILTEIVKRLEL